MQEYMNLLIALCKHSELVEVHDETGEWMSYVVVHQWYVCSISMATFISMLEKFISFYIFVKLIVSPTN